jgi:cytoskeleton protein RodZ
MNAAVAPGDLGIGARLRAGRERTGATIIQAAEKLHLDPKILEALEREAFEVLGAEVYVRGHLRHYAELVGESAAELQRLYADSLRPHAPPDITQAPRAARAPDPRKLARPLLVVAGGVVLAAGVWWVLNDLRLPLVAGPDLTTAPSMPRAESSTQPAAAVAPDSSAVIGASPAGMPRTTSPTTAQLAPAGDATVPASEMVRATAATTEPASSRASSASQAAGDAPAAAERSSPVELRLVFSADSWVEVYDARGERLFYDVATGNTVETLRGTPPLRVTLGNAPAVSVAVNGSEVPIPESARRADGAQFVVNRAGRLARAR